MRTRNVVVLVALSACGDDGGGNNNMVDAATMGDSLVMPDAPPSVDGMWKDTYHTANGVMTVSSCVAPSAVKVDPTTAITDVYPGTCHADGTFTIQAPTNLGTYYLKANGVLYETNKRAGIDLSTDRLGRNDVAAITGVTLDLALTNMTAWSGSDTIAAFGANIGFRQNLSFSTGAPAQNDTSLTATASWNGYKLDGAKNDNLVVVQLARHTTGGGLGFSSLDRVYNAPTFTMANNAAQSLAGSFTTATAGQLTLAIDVASFNQFASAAGPTVTAQTIQGNAFAAVSTDTIESPPLFTFAQASDGLSTMNFGTVFFTDPWNSAWARLVKVSVGFTVPYVWNGANGSLNAQVMRVVPKATAEAGSVIANLGPPTQVTFDGASATTATSITAVPLLAWSAPIVGNASDYEIQVYEVKTVGTSLTFTSVLRLITKQTSVRIPQGYLLGQRQYVFQVRARTRGSIDVYTTPLRNGAAWSAADTLTALVTTN